MANVYIVALAAYACFSMTDASVKAAGAHLPVFETAFIVNLFAGLTLLATRHPGERWRDFFRTGNHTLVVHGRAICGVAASLGGVYAFTTIPFAQAYALIFLAPLFVTVMSVLFLREQVPALRWVGAAVSFVGVLMVVRPGYHTLEAGHLAAICVGIGTGAAVVILRGMRGRVRTTSILGTLIAYLLVLNAVAMLIRGVTMPTWQQFALLGFAGVAFGLGQWAFVMAARVGNANQIAPMHYSQLVWAVMFGSLFFDERLDGVALTGVAIIIASGMLTVLGGARVVARTGSGDGRKAGTGS